MNLLVHLTRAVCRNNPAVSAPVQSKVVGIAAPARVGALLRVGPEAPSVVWSRPAPGLHAVGLGVAVEGPSEVEWLGGPPPFLPPGPCFGGWAFDAARPWSGFASERWFVPEVLASWDGQRPWLFAFGPDGTSEAALRARLARVEEVEPVTGRLEARRLGDDGTAYRALVTRALEEIGSGRVSKLVPARAIDVVGEREFSERAVLEALEARFPTCTTFLVRGADGSAFVGATPETLCEVRHGALRTEALAGTCAPGQGTELLASEKDRREHGAVVAGIRAALSPLVVGLEVLATPSLRELSNVTHLWTPIQARVVPGVAALDVARALHPTPAVAGTPVDAAREWLATHEGFERGWYAGAVGTRSAAGCELVVALRSALLRGATARVFAGAGVVEGSTPQAELEETGRKARPLLSILGVDDG